MPEAKKTSWSKMVFINMIVITGILLLLEILIRIVYPGLHSVGEDKLLYNKIDGQYGYTPLAFGDSHGALFEIDEKGHRKSNLYSDNEKKILLIGDSVSVGVGVQADKVYPALLDKSLNNHSIVNPSVGGYSYQDYSRVLKKKLDAQKYIGVLIGIVLNDYSSTSQTGIVDNLKNRGHKTLDDYKTRYPNIIIRLLRYFNDNYFNFNKYLHQHYMTSLWIKSLLTDSQKNFYQHDSAFYQKESAISLLSAEILNLKNIVESRGLWVKFMLFPYEYQLRKESLDFLPQEKILIAAKMAGAQVYDFTKLFADKEKSSDLFLHLDPMHFSNEGHQLVADEIKSRVLENLQ